MNIVITSLSLENFKCFRSKEIFFSSDINTLLGRNGSGKTTIADAILFCLFGKNSAGQSDLELFKTRGSDGIAIPHLNHSVTITLNVTRDASHSGLVDGSVGGGSAATKAITLQRTIREVWVKRRGTDEQVFKNNTVEYFVNGEAYTAADYKKFISSLIDEETFRIITNPDYFPSKKWQDQRIFLSSLVPELSAEEFADTPDLQQLADHLATTDETLESYLKHLRYQIREVKEKLDRIPVRLQEQNKALPERLDWPKLEVEYTDVLRQSKEVEAKIIALKSGNGAEEVLRDEIRKEIRAIRTDMEKIEAEQRKNLRLRQDEHDAAVRAARQKFNALVSSQRETEQAIPSFDTLKKRCQETIEQCEQDAQAIREEWFNNLNRRLHFSDSDCTCPTCGQYLPEEQVAEKRQKAEANLNADKARIKDELNKRAAKVKATRAEAEAAIADYEQKRTEAESALASIKEQINEAFAEKQELEKRQLPTLGDLLKKDVQYVASRTQLQEKQAQLQSVDIADDEETKTQLADLEAKKVEFATVSQQLQSQLATKPQYDRIQQIIADINTEQKQLVKQLSELERQEDTARQYQFRQNTILEEHINSLFSIVRWKLFRTVNNAGDSFEEPFCECYVDGIPYGGGLNQAARLNAGLDIINTLCRHYNVTAPIVIDNAESNLNILPTSSQQIRLQVADTDLQFT